MRLEKDTPWRQNRKNVNSDELCTVCKSNRKYEIRVLGAKQTVHDKKRETKNLTSPGYQRVLKRFNKENPIQWNRQKKGSLNFRLPLKR